jgi:hypothetical protein
MGGFDKNHYFYAEWPDHMWQAVQRRKSSSSLHMEALQVLVAARALGPTWANTAVTMRLDCLALVHTLRKGYHQHDAVNAIMRELSNLQIKHSSSLRSMWVRRCWNEAADALSKNDMERFLSNVEGNRTLVKLEPHHLAPPLSNGIRGLVPGKRKPQHRGRNAPSINVLAAQGGLRERHGQTFERRPLRKVSAIPAKAQVSQARAQVQVAGANPYKRFCIRAGFKVLAPPLKDMRERVKLWMYDAPQTYVTPDGKTKKGIKTSSIKTYLSHIHRWYSDLAQESKGCISRFGSISNLQKVIDANFKCGDKQVHCSFGMVTAVSITHELP